MARTRSCAARSATATSAIIDSAVLWISATGRSDLASVLSCSPQVTQLASPVVAEDQSPVPGQHQLEGNGHGLATGAGLVHRQREVADVEVLRCTVRDEDLERQGHGATVVAGRVGDCGVGRGDQDFARVWWTASPALPGDPWVVSSTMRWSSKVSLDRADPSRGPALPSSGRGRARAPPHRPRRRGGSGAPIRGPSSSTTEGTGYRPTRRCPKDPATVAASSR